MIEVIAAIATYGVTTLAAEYDGPIDILLKLRSRLSVFRCASCASVWVAIPIAYMADIGVVGYLFCIGTTLILDRWVNL